MKMFIELYQYRELLKNNVKKELRGKYKGSLLGVAWSFINPLLQVFIYALIFPYIMRIQTENYLQFLICGITAWNFFSQIIKGGLRSIRENGGIIKKVYFPRVILPISTTLTAIVNFLISMIIIVIFCLLGGLGISWHLILMPLSAVLVALFALGVALILTSINVYIKDTEYIVDFLLNLVFYATPILFTLDLFPEPYRSILHLNPVAHLIEIMRDCCISHTFGNAISYLYLLITGIIFLFIGCVVFEHLQKGFVEEL